MTKKISTVLVITVIVVLAIILVGGALAYQYYFQPKVGEDKAGKILTDCEKLSNAEKRWICYVDVVGKNVQLCNTLSEDIRKVTCIVHVAVNNKDPNFCELAEDAKKKDQCYLGYAGWTKEKDICDKIQNSSYRQYCYSNINNLIKK